MSDQNENATLEELYRSMEEQIEHSASEPPLRRARREAPAGKNPLPLLAAAALLLVLVGIFALWMSRDRGSDPGPTEPTTATTGTTTITIAAGGDINITDGILQAAAQPDGTYDFGPYFRDAAPLLSRADLAIVNLEGTLASGKVDGQTRNGPEALARALAQAGVDVVQTANSYSVTQGLSGLSETMSAIRNAGMQTAGTSATAEEYARSHGVTLLNVQGVKVALVAFTKGVGNLNLPEGSEHCVNLLYKDYASTYTKIDTEGIQAALSAAKALSPDVTIALLHWGSEYDRTVSATQQSIRKLMFDGGVDAIIGTHSHVVGEMKEEDGRFTAYSLGDLCGLDTTAHTRASVVLQLEFTKDNASGVTTLTGYSYTPVYLADSSESPAGISQILNLRNELALYDQEHYIRVTGEVYQQLRDALEDLEERITPAQED